MVDILWIWANYLQVKKRDEMRYDTLGPRNLLVLMGITHKGH